MGCAYQIGLMIVADCHNHRIKVLLLFLTCALHVKSQFVSDSTLNLQSTACTCFASLPFCESNR